MAAQRILLGITGGIAAYKSAELVRLLKKAGAEVRVVMTGGAEAFVRPLTFQALSGEPVRTSLLDPEAEAGMGHIELAKWADRVVVAPASADFLARLAHGLADDLLTTVCCATEAPIAVAPAMNQAMWKNHRNQRNMALLADDPQISVWGPGQGDQACGDTGLGRMLEPEDLADRLLNAVGAIPAGVLAGKRLVITAGPTREPIDPVRYISNHSSGKMGYAIAEAAAQAGASVTLVSGPVSIPVPEGVQVVPVETAEEMLAASQKAVDEGCDVFVATAAVADYRPESQAANKIKKSSESMNLSLVRNPDTLASVAARPDAPFTVGFAAETSDVEHYATDKMRRKKLDMIVANDVSSPGLGFNSDRNAVTVFWPQGQTSIGPDTKLAIAERLVALIAQHSDKVTHP
ncbi:bifunctional phosphopantothenoylcysteine decarboxylase/phosphopantothenate--cysteine ligase CoaBC [Marinobacter persicus]|jgi:phosphopantothenoylcysteine decarboxylase/phosphopantothenate--cysteine ligase|uniref:Coenzyme A biosynthesis bifunctional protein CoaBC n=1 Tax=Marinobacter persicus TaxID=930118 RepID=A0A2S6G2L2_9GAMM|nr:bifunctional phosphopantothenoylcysteine decarboxylase/phosphopantothenate--cysteine ligase CoaBC [Marinobacter persicus]KXS51076.1 MAG: phosphopantothenoylcysteine decarboxylase / phosphopantothenate--cysteine ligase [Marinobacter sp. T13-3]PPK50007.1 phosphopantothenoylcysteine decarboxylase/phosphopantothenate--cysteine ligase [Marinobacter persicus]PPK52053.1 phosphopantothenoylcysteine decarboxylase/phosphopantothenate--cysteine ligase [Marinobacter persicus]PPK56584.1 phosphopantotheno